MKWTGRKEEEEKERRKEEKKERRKEGPLSHVSKNVVRHEFNEYCIIFEVKKITKQENLCQQQRNLTIKKSNMAMKVNERQCWRKQYSKKSLI